MAGKPTGRKNRAVVIGAAVATAVVLAGMMAFLMYRSRSSHTWSILRAWYAETPDGPVVVVGRGDYTKATYSNETRYSHSGRGYESLYSHRLADGRYLGGLKLDHGHVVGLWHGRLWLDFPKASNRPLLVAANGLGTVADRQTILQKVGGQLGGDFQVSGSLLGYNPYSGEIELEDTKGKTHLLSTELTLRPIAEHGKIPPEGYNCNAQGTDLIDSRRRTCLPPGSAPATALAASYRTAIKRKRPKDPPLLSGISSHGFGVSLSVKVLWTKSFQELAGAPTPALRTSIAQIQVLEPHRAVLLITDEKRLYLAFFNPTDGSVLDRKTLFGPTAPPGPPPQ